MSSTILAIWNVILILLLLYAPGLITLFFSLICFICKLKIPGIILIIISVLFFIGSSVILYLVLDYIFMGDIFTIFNWYNF